MRGTTAAALAFCLMTTFARAGVLLTDPGLFVMGSSAPAFEARARLDSEDNAWKSAVFGPDSTAPLATGGGQGAGAWKHGKTQGFTLDYTAADDHIEFSVAGKRPAATVPDIGANLAGFEFVLTANEGNAVELTNLEVSINGGAWQPLPGGGAFSASGGVVHSPMFMVESVVSTFSLRGDASLRFASPAPGDALSFGVRGYQADPAPGPSSPVVFTAMACLVVLRRRR